MTAPSPSAAEDAAARVRAGLRALVQDPSAWPPGDARAWRSRLLDHGGGDAHAHVALAWEAHAWGVAARLGAESASDPGERVRRVARAFAASHFTEAAAAHWVVRAWAEALGVVDADERPTPSAPASGPSNGVGRSPFDDSAHEPGRHLVMPRHAMPRHAMPRHGMHRSGPRPWPQPVPRRPPVPAVPTGRLAFIGVTGVAGAMVAMAWLMRAVTPDRSAPVAAPPVTPATAAATAAPRPGPLAATAGAGASGIGGTYRVTTTNVWVGGDEACRDPSTAPAEGTVTHERVTHAPGAGIVALASRPGVRAVLSDDGSFAATGLAGVRGATSWRLAWSGRFDETGFRAATDLRTATLGAWRRVTRCRIVATLVGVRLGP